MKGKKMSDTTEQERNNQQPSQQTSNDKSNDFPFFQPVQVQSDSWLKSVMVWNAIFNERGGVSQKERD